MDDHTPAEELPALYRAILDGIAALEAAGRRDDAVWIRRAATRAYSRAWDARARRELEGLLREVTPRGPASRPFARRGRTARPVGPGQTIVPASER